MTEIKAVLIFEMLGRPAEHLKTTLEQFIDKVSKESGIEILNKKIHEPKKIEETKQELFTTFAETEINFKTVSSLLKIVFGYMPSHVEIIYPEEIRIKNFELNEMINELVRRLHQYDEITKTLAIERNVLQRQLQQQGVNPISIIPPQPKTSSKEIKKTRKQLSLKKRLGREKKKKKR